MSDVGFPLSEHRSMFRGPRGTTSCCILNDLNSPFFPQLLEVIAVWTGKIFDHVVTCITVLVNSACDVVKGDSKRTQCCFNLSVL